ncbi:unnamed protein product [Vitrella brassicaformis CCMP3155]|uniref:Uncharacterized protein n=1 Tax=Vitrella brassicaformis (strain CCMP3155) TaxID=1169540 RepID=A0A0G4F2A6_VITBC|nr:unnamed protein product [Vitrella brassicaformis CCMP3155]|eukprot:CEM05499.1 unnamed protein product [Vitrella brassicaformis CCMP3155]
MPRGLSLGTYTQTVTQLKEEMRNWDRWEQPLELATRRQLCRHELAICPASIQKHFPSAADVTRCGMPQAIAQFAAFGSALGLGISIARRGGGAAEFSMGDRRFRVVGSMERGVDDRYRRHYSSADPVVEDIGAKCMYPTFSQYAAIRILTHPTADDTLAFKEVASAPVTASLLPPTYQALLTATPNQIPNTLVIDSHASRGPDTTRLIVLAGHTGTQGEGDLTPAVYLEARPLKGWRRAMMRLLSAERAVVGVGADRFPVALGLAREAPTTSTWMLCWTPQCKLRLSCSCRSAAAAAAAASRSSEEDAPFYGDDDQSAPSAPSPPPRGHTVLRRGGSKSPKHHAQEGGETRLSAVPRKGVFRPPIPSLPPPRHHTKQGMHAAGRTKIRGVGGFVGRLPPPSAPRLAAGPVNSLGALEFDADTSEPTKELATSIVNGTIAPATLPDLISASSCDVMATVHVGGTRRTLIELAIIQIEDDTLARQVVEALIQAGTDVDGGWPIKLAIKRVRLDIAEALLQQRHPVVRGIQLLREVAKCMADPAAKARLVDRLLPHCVDPQQQQQDVTQRRLAVARSLARELDIHSGRTPLQWFCIHPLDDGLLQRQTLNHLVHYGGITSGIASCTMARDNGGRTLLQLACEAPHPNATVGFLLQHRAAEMVKEPVGRPNTALELAAQNPAATEETLLALLESWAALPDLPPPPRDPPKAASRRTATSSATQPSQPSWARRLLRVYRVYLLERLPRLVLRAVDDAIEAIDPPQARLNRLTKTGEWPTHDPTHPLPKEITRRIVSYHQRQVPPIIPIGEATLSRRINEKLAHHVECVKRRFARTGQMHIIGGAVRLPCWSVSAGSGRRNLGLCELVYRAIAAECQRVGIDMTGSDGSPTLTHSRSGDRWDGAAW